VLQSAYKLLRHKVSPSLGSWDPILAVYYLTYACDYRCPYCSDGAQRPYYQLRSEVLPATEVLGLLRRIRGYCDELIITGGEPLKHPDFAEIVSSLGGLGFEHLVLTTNGDGLAPHLDRLPGNISDLVFSLDTLDHAKADAIYGVGAGALQRILDTVELAARQRRRGYSVTISSVVTPDNIEDLYAVCDFAWSRGFSLAACPQLVGVKAHQELNTRPDYRRFYQHLIAAKKKGLPVYGTVPYLEHMRDLRWFQCRPLTMLAVAPGGEVFYPCLELGNVADNLLQHSDLDAILRRAREKYGDPPRCDTRCHSACALSFALLLESPASLVGEGLLRARQALRAARGG